MYVSIVTEKETLTYSLVTASVIVYTKLYEPTWSGFSKITLTAILLSASMIG